MNNCSNKRKHSKTKFTILERFKPHDVLFSLSLSSMNLVKNITGSRNVIKELMNGNESLLFGLTSSFEAEEFYYKLGFKKHKTALAKYPGKSIYLED